MELGTPGRSISDRAITLYNNDYRIAFRLYRQRRYVESLHLLADILWELKEPSDIQFPENWRRDVDYLAYKAWVMSNDDASRAVVLPVKAPILEQRIAQDQNPTRRRVVWIVETFENGFVVRLGVRLHDFIERHFR